ncbi:MAG: ABC transporter ATP-binding protein [Alkaliphilus sp.]
MYKEEELSKTYDSKIMRRLLTYAKPYWFSLSICVVLIALITITNLAQPYIIKIAIDDYIIGNSSADILYSNNSISGLTSLSIIFLFFIIARFVLSYVQVYLLNYISNKIIYNIRQELFSHLQNMSLSFFDKTPIGRLVTRVTNDTETLHEMYSGVLVNLFNDIFLLIGIILVMIHLDVKLALLSFIVIPIIVVSTLIFRIKARKVYRTIRLKIAKINSALNENLTGMKTIHVFKREKQQFKKYDTINKELLAADKQEIFIFSVFRPSMEIVRSLGIAIIIWYGGGQVLQGTMSFGILFAFIDYIKRFFKPINDMTEKVNILQSAMASSERIFALLDKRSAISSSSNPLNIQKLVGSIEFKNVWFAYNEDEWVLKDISFKINPSESVAFVGATGAGKSSIINLIGRLYDIQKGEILIDGVNIKSIPLKTLRKNIGVVLQDVFMFTGTIKDNIVLNNKSISSNQITSVTDHVNATAFINNLPHKFDEPVMERGVNFSTGQRQLIAFARALILEPSILILDEATSNIDTETEALIQDAIAKIIKGRTTIAVAHRLSTIQNCDKIIVLSNGRIKEVGNHQELLRNESTYYKLYQLQYRENSWKMGIL